MRKRGKLVTAKLSIAIGHFGCTADDARNDQLQMTNYQFNIQLIGNLFVLRKKEAVDNLKKRP